MDIIEIILAAAKSIEFVEYVSGTSRIQVKDYPAVVVEEEDGFSFEQCGAEVKPLIENQECTLFYLKRGLNEDEMQEDLYNTFRRQMKIEARMIAEKVFESLSGTDGVANIEIGKENNYNTKINSEPVEVSAITITAKIILR